MPREKRKGGAGGKPSVEADERRQQAMLANQVKQARVNEANRNIFKNMTSLNNFLTNLDEYSPTVPEAVTEFYMNKGGVEAGDPRMENTATTSKKTQKRKMAEVANKTEDTFQEEDLDRALIAAGVRVRRSKFKSAPKH